MDNCYNCGIELNDENRTREHIPAQNTFAGYSNEYKQNRLTVPACHTCNNQYSKIDQEVRDAIGIMNEDNEEQQELTRKSVKSIMRRRNWMDRVHFSDGKVVAVSFDYNVFRELHIKNFKGVFYEKYGYPIPDKYGIEIIAEGDEEDQKLMGIAQHLYNYVSEGNDWNVSGHEDIFQYKMKSLTPDANDQIFDSSDLKNALGIVSVLVYHKNLSPVIIAAKKDFLERIKTTRQQRV
ncbi:hypothetical protein ACE939_04100 [Aquimarina sp. W85]|uniref:hypothetical protein n=1 Tax=Aquimarina rhodophyticola TaxID=3342246 RepID=UPI00366D076F